MSKQLNINLGFTADTSQATTAITKLSMELQQLGSSSTIGNNLPINAQLLKAQASAKELATVLKSSFNVDTGKLDLNKFNSSLQASGKTLSSYGHQLGMLGTKGDQAFLQLSQAIVQTEIPLRRSSTLLTQFATTLKNTARWQLSSSLLHGFIGAISSAYNYSKDLNESLNNIRIVTGYSSDKMGEFAVQANKAAKALSTTTNEYAKASLIYFQQGLDDSQVKERTAVTIKMANVSRQSAETVSDQMTAVWNNFDDGSKSLEYFADVMVELGAKTASSSDEIAGGLEKFAAIGQTIGLSFEYAASALATITANTRQSEEVVGTALKTIFARIQGLKLGETLEDGVTLNKYSEALQTVGISIFDQNSQLKDMDSILNELGSKWDTMSKAQQTALTQTVAGVRQYNQLMSLMNNWDDMQSNLELSYGATGSLEEQNKIFEESWQASANRVKASLESIWGALIYDEFFINLNNAFADLLDFIKQIIDAAGGLKGVLAGVALILTSVFKEQMATGINNMIHNFRVFSGAAVSDMRKVQKEAYDMSMAMTKGLGDDPSIMALRTSLETTYTLQTELNEKIKQMSPEQAKAAREAIKIAENYNQIVIEMAQAVKKSEELYQNQNKIANQNLGNKAQEKMVGLNDLAFGQGGGQLLNTSQEMINMAKNMSDVEGMGAAIDNVTRAMQDYRTAMRNNEGTEAMTQRANVLINALNHLTETTGTSAQGFEKYQSKLRSSAEIVVNAVAKFNDIKFGPDQNLTKDKIASLKEFAKVAEQTGIPVESLSKALSNFSNEGNFEGNIKEREAALKALKQALIETTVSEEAMTNAIANRAKGNIQGSETTKHLTADEKQLANIIRQLIVDEKSFENGLRSQGQAAQEASNKIKEVGLAYKSIGSATTGLFQGLSSFGMGISSLMSLWDTLKNPDLSGFEKALQIMISFGMAIPMVTTGLSSFGNVIKFVISKQGEGLTASLAHATGMKAEEYATKGYITVAEGEKIIRKEITGETLKQVIAEGQEVTITEIDTKATWKNVGAKMAQYSWLLLIVAGLAVLGTGLTVASNLYNADAIAAEKAAEAAKNASQAFDEAQSAYEKFKGSIDDYSNAIKGMNELKKGTAAYTEQLIKANDAAMDLINSQNLISGEHYKVNADTGLIEFLPGQFEEIQRQQLANLESAQGYRAFANQRAKTAQAKADQTEFNREKLKGKGWSQENTASAVGATAATAGGALIGTGISAAIAIKAGTAIGTALAPGIGTAIGAGIGALVGAGMLIAAELNESTGEEKKAVQALQQEAKKRGDNSIFEKGEMEAFLRAQGEYSDDLIKSMVENNIAIQQQVEALHTNTEAIRASIEQGAGAANRDNALYQGLGTTPEQQEKYQNLADKIISNRADDVLADEDSEAYKNARGKNEELFKGKWWNTDDSAAYEKYLQARFGDEAENYQVVNQGGTNATLQKKNEEGTWENVGEKNTLSNDEVLDFLTQHDLSQFNEQDKIILDDIIKVEDTISKNVDIADKDALTEISSGLAEGKPLDLSLMDPQEKDELKAFLSEGGAELGNKLGQDYIDALNQAIDNYDPKVFKARMEQESKAILEQGAAELEMTSEALEAYTSDLMKNNKELKDNKKLAAQAAVESAKFGNNLDKLEKSLNDNIKAINKEKDAVKKSLDYYEALGEVQRSFEKTFGVEVDSEFITKNLDKIQKAAKGDITAIDELRKALMDDIIANIILENDLDETATTNVMNAYNTLKANMPDLEVGASLDSGPFIDALNELISQAGMTAPQVNQLLSGMGMSATFASEPQSIQGTQTITTTEHVIENRRPVYDQEGKYMGEAYTEKEYTTQEQVPVEDMVQAFALETAPPGETVVPKINSITKNPPPIKTNRVSNPNGGGGGGGGKPKVVQKKAPIKEKKAKDEIERYHEIKKAIEDQERLLDRLSKAKDKTYGANKLKAIDKEIAALQKLNELDSQHLKQIREKLALDKKAASDKGITFDINGRINNYDEIIQKKMDSWLKEQEDIQKREIEYEESKNADENYDADGAIKLQIEQDKEKSDEYYEEFKETIEQYEETYSLFEDTVDKMQEQFDQMAEKTIEKITYGVEFKVEFEEAAIDLLDFQIKLLSKDFEGFSEIAMLTMTKVSHLNEILQAEGNEGIGALYEAYYQGTISLDQFAQTVQDSIPEILSAMEELMSVDEEMMEYYSQTFDAAEEKFTEYLDFIDGGTAKLDHLRNMLSLIGKEQNYDMLGVVLESQYTSASHKLQASSDWYEITKKEYDALYNRWITEKDLLGPKELEMLEDKLKVARTKMQEADEQRLSDLEVIGEKAQEILQNNLDKARKKLEETLVGSSLEDYMTELDRLSKKQEEYLTATNKMYETNKLIRQAQMEMNKTDNNRAKQQYNDYVKYIEQLQESGKLSSYELSVAQAKYELLQAQIALEEAKDAKDQVRLTRDSEGNYGYVYTANEDKVSGAEQAVADAENKLYNIGLEGAQDYQSKKAEILQEAIDTFASIEEQYQTGQIETEAEFNAKMEEAKQYYYDRLKEYDNLYYMALGVMQEESYGNTVDYELDSRNIFNTFANTVDDYLGDVEQSFTDYNSKVEVVKQEVGDDLGAISQKTEEVTKKTEELAIEAEKLTGQIDNELLSVREATSIWGSYRDELYKNIEANKTLIDQLKTIQQLASGEIEDYSSFISEQVANGKGYDDQLVQTALAKRWLKMEGEDDYDYSQMKNDYVQEYADANELSFEEAETALKDDAWYKTLGMLRQYKIERTDWTAIKKEILDKNPEADVSWIDSIIAEKLNYDWSAKIKKYIEDNPGLKYSDEYLQEMLTIRKIKIDSLEDPKSVISNDELLAPYIEKGKLIDDRKNVSSAVSAATGGYTGEWGPEGKIAILHEKELILNAQDTQNFLSAVEILREINGILDQNALVASLGAINMQALSLNSLADQMLQQEVTIHADFPNVTDHNEIELAIDNLINAASQHAYRT